MSQQAKQRLQAQEDHAAELVKTLQAQIAHRFTRLAEEEALLRLTNEGASSEQVAAKAWLFMDSRDMEFLVAFRSI
jgi:hypothetical protein